MDMRTFGTILMIFGILLIIVGVDQWSTSEMLSRSDNKEIAAGKSTAMTISAWVVVTGFVVGCSGEYLRNKYRK